MTVPNMLLMIYKDEACTIPASPHGELKIGVPDTEGNLTEKIFYIKNMGDQNLEDVTITLGTTDLQLAAGDQVYWPYGRCLHLGSMVVGESRKFRLQGIVRDQVIFAREDHNRVQLFATI